MRRKKCSPFLDILKMTDNCVIEEEHNRLFDMSFIYYSVTIKVNTDIPPPNSLHYCWAKLFIYSGSTKASWSNNLATYDHSNQHDLTQLLFEMGCVLYYEPFAHDLFLSASLVNSKRQTINFKFINPQLNQGKGVV